MSLPSARQWKIAIAGGSLGGLCAGLTLDRAGPPTERASVLWGYSPIK
jgi:2-polyprenyl-6-methoxyphenol hydroxylase-like FAD-dependent oxidoreductase